MEMGLIKPIQPKTGFALVSRWADFNEFVAMLRKSE
jgi:hypothetical protein